MKILWLLLLVAGCGGADGGIFDYDCSEHQRDTINEFGEPHTIQRYDADNYHSHTYWYWSRGYSKTFTWQDDGGECETSTYTFEPI